MAERCATAIVVHGGTSAGMDTLDGCELAAHTGNEILAGEGAAIDAAIQAVVVLENDGRFNAGVGSGLGLDGATIEADAGVMDSAGILGAVACLQRVKNPVLVARAVADSPHCLLAGAGAEQFARTVGVPVHQPEPNARVREEYRQVLQDLRGKKELMPGISNDSFSRYWNYAGAPPVTEATACDTVGAVTRDTRGRFGVAVSTGGSAPALLGRVGDSPLIGCGFYAGKSGAVACTGIGEFFIRTLLAYTVYCWLDAGMPLERALQRGIDMFDKEVPAGLIAVTRAEAGVAANRDMPTAKVEHE